MRDYWDSANGLPAITALHWAKCCEVCCRWRRRSATGKFIRLLMPDATPHANFCWRLRLKIRSLEKRGFIFPEQIHEDRDPLRAPSDRLLVEVMAARPEGKLSKPERELIAFLELHPGAHNLKDL